MLCHLITAHTHNAFCQKLQKWQKPTQNGNGTLFPVSLHTNYDCVFSVVWSIFNIELWHNHNNNGDDAAAAVDGERTRNGKKVNSQFLFIIFLSLLSFVISVFMPDKYVQPVDLLPTADFIALGLFCTLRVLCLDYCRFLLLLFYIILLLQ